MEKIITKRKLCREKQRKEVSKYVVVVGPVGFSFVKYGANKVMDIMYEDLLHYPQYSRWRGVEEKILQELQEVFQEQLDTDIILVYSEAEENRIKKIMLENKREFGEW